MSKCRLLVRASLTQRGEREAIGTELGSIKGNSWVLGLSNIHQAQMLTSGLQLDGEL